MKFHDYFYTGYEATFFIAEGGEREKTPYPNPLFTKKNKKMTSSCALGLSLNFLSLGIVNISFQSDGTGKYATPTRNLNFPFALLAVSYQIYPW